MKTYKPYIASLSYSFFVGLSFLITKLVVPYASATVILAHRFTVSFIIYTLFSIATKKNFSLNLKKIITLLPITLFYPILFFSLQVYGLKYLSSSEAGIIFATVPIITVTLTAMIGQFPSRTQIISIVLSVSGVIIIFANNIKLNNEATIGILVLFLSAVSFSIYTIIIKNFLKKTNVYELTFVIIAIGFFIFNIMFAIEQPSIRYAILSYLAPLKTKDYLLGIFYLGFFASVASSLASNYALQHISSPEFSVYSNLSTLISVVAGAIVLKEPLYLQHIIGIPLILIGVIGTNFATFIDSKFS